MKKKTKKHSDRSCLFSFCFLMIVTTLLSSVTIPVAAKNDPAPVSPALYILAEENAMASAALKGSPMKLSGEDFARAMNLSSVYKITVTETPPVTDGELRVGSIVVQKGQSISGSSLSLLTYVASNASITTSSFRFSVNDSPVDLRCDLFFLDKVNQCPTLSMVPETSLNVSTHRNITLHGTLPCFDPDGDETVIEIVSYPKSGILILTDRATGAYTYTPTVQTAAKDSFTYVARDRYGNYSAAATVSLTVVKPSTSVVYADLVDSPLYNAALDVTEAGIMSGGQIGSQSYFYPNQSVSRGEFVVMAMHAVGITEPQAVSDTLFSDDDTVPVSMKPYLATAHALGFIQGETLDNGSLCFYPDREITRAEAAVILSRMMDAPIPTVKPEFSDSAEAPAWAVSSLQSLNALGILTTSGGQIRPLDTLTRGDTALILSTVMRVTK